MRKFESELRSEFLEELSLYFVIIRTGCLILETGEFYPSNATKNKSIDDRIKESSIRIMNLEDKVGSNKFIDVQKHKLDFINAQFELYIHKASRNYNIN